MLGSPHSSMCSTPTSARGPSPAERARSLLAASTSLSLVWEGGQLHLEGRHVVDKDGGVQLALPLESQLALNVLSAEVGDVPVVLDFTDVSPIPVRRRTRARMAVAGWLAPLGRLDAATPARQLLDLAPDSLLVHLTDIGEVHLYTDDDSHEIALDELEEATPDLLAADEADLLHHLMTHHEDALALLPRLIDDRIALHAERIVPVALHSYGIVLRVERPRADVDVTLPFVEPLAMADDLGAELGMLLSEALARPCRPRLGVHHGAPPEPNCERDAG